MLILASGVIRESGLCSLLSLAIHFLEVAMSGGGDGGGSHVWPWKDNRPVPFPLSGIPMTIKDLIGRKCRLVRYGDSTTADIEPGRITVFLNEDGRIQDIYLDPETSDVPLTATYGGGGMDSGG
jgi:hypothetical protein